MLITPLSTQNQAPALPALPVVVENLVKRFGNFVAVDNVSFSVKPGEVFGWLGPNGAGKTTTIRILLGLLKPTSGSTSVLGFDSHLQKGEVHARVGYMSQQFTLYNELTPWENIRFYGGVHEMTSAAMRQRIPEIIHMAGLEGREKAMTRTLSGGWKQRLALGCAIVHNPGVVFLDEPTAGVDPISRRQFWELIYQMAGGGVTVVVTTHYMDEAELCQRIGFISQGKLVALASPAELKKNQMRGFVIEINASKPVQVVRILKTAAQNRQLLLDEVALYGAQVHAVVPDVPVYKEKIMALLLANQITVRSIEWIAPSLEDVFISTVKDPLESHSV
ncbi:MAG: ABC transporter ATP-binding protein [Anaerolineaceae bacterium]|nr:ABC transporter ATP-binding protein [Anaerolineaceae bacterium]